MEWLLLSIILAGLGMIDGTLRKFLKSQDEHSLQVTARLSEIHDRMRPNDARQLPVCQGIATSA